MSGEIVNKVTGSGLLTIDLEDIYPAGERAVFDLKDFLWQGLALKEKDFRTALKEYDWTVYEGKYVALFCSVDTIVPIWAFMLVTKYLEPYCIEVIYGNAETMESNLFKKAIGKLNLNDYNNQRVVVKGCGKLPVPVAAYVELTKVLRPVAKSIMFGEPCSTVPIYKKTK